MLSAPEAPKFPDTAADGSNLEAMASNLLASLGLSVASGAVSLSPLHSCEFWRLDRLGGACPLMPQDLTKTVISSCGEKKDNERKV